MDIETAAGNGPGRYSQRYAAYLLSACLHAGLAFVVLTMVPESAKFVDIVPVEIVELASEGPKGGGQLTGSPGPAGLRPDLLSTARPDKRPESLPLEIREPESVFKKDKQDRENADKTTASDALHTQETKNNLPDGGVQGGSSGGQDTGGKGGGLSDGQGNGGKGQGLQNFGTGQAKFDLHAYQAAVRARIEAAKQYPMAARKRHMEGNVVVSFRLSREGRLIMMQVAQSSGVGFLDDAALSAIKDGAPYPRYPGGENDMPTSMTVNIAFILK